MPVKTKKTTKATRAKKVKKPAVKASAKKTRKTKRNDIVTGDQGCQCLLDGLKPALRLP